MNSKQPTNTIASLQHIVQVTVLALSGVYLVFLLLSGRIVHYIAERFAWLTWVAAALFLLMATAHAWSLLVESRKHGDDEHDHADHEHHDHEHAAAGSLGGWFGVVVAALPLLLGILVPPRALTSAAVGGEVETSLGNIEVAPGDAIRLDPEARNILDWLRIFSVYYDDPARLAEFNGQPAEIVGFVTRDSRHAADEFTVARLVMTCCVNDVQDYGLVVRWPDAASLPKDTWVRVRGSFELQSFNDEPAMVLLPAEEGVSRISAPENPYLYP